MLLYGFSFGQIINGTVETENGNPISNANVYIDGSKIATLSTADGSFTIDKLYKAVTFFVRCIELNHS